MSRLYRFEYSVIYIEVYHTLLWEGFEPYDIWKWKIEFANLKAFDRGVKTKDIPTLFPVSLDPVKRLSRYNSIKKILWISTTYLTIKVHMLGLKALYLYPLCKNNDWEGLIGVLTCVDPKTTRKKLPLLKSIRRKKRMVFIF